MSNNNLGENTDPITNDVPATNNATNDLDAANGALTDLKKEYDQLAEDIKIKYEEQQTIFQNMASDQYDGKDYDADRINHLIQTNVNNLKQQRDNIWKYLTTVYNKNTQQTYRNLKNIKNNEKQILNFKKRKEKLRKDVLDLKSENNTKKKQIQYSLYRHKTIYNKTYAQFILMIALITCIVIMYLTERGNISPMVGWGSVIVIASIAVIYYLYRIYVYRMNRDKFSWHKTQYKRIDPELEPNENNNDNDTLDRSDLDLKAQLAFSGYNTTCNSNK